MEDKKLRKCLRCKQEKPITAFAETSCRFFPGHRSLYCTSCLEATTPQDNLGEVDRVLRWLDLPFDLNKWTQLYEQHKDHTFTAYFNLLYDDHYEGLKW